MKKINLILALIEKGKISFLVNGITKRLYSKVYSFGLKRDLTIDFINPDSLIDIKIRTATIEDNSFFDEENSNIGLVEANIPNCYVVVDENDIPYFRLWLIGFLQNDKIQNFFKKIFPILKKNEALIESVFTIPNFRGKGIMSAAISRISEKEVQAKTKYLMAFVNTSNVPSLKGFKKSGFYPYILREESWFLFRNKVSFLEIPEALKRDYDKLL